MAIKHGRIIAPYNMGYITQAFLRWLQLQEEMCTCHGSATAICLKGMNGVWICLRLWSEQLESFDKQSIKEADPSQIQQLAKEG